MLRNELRGFDEGQGKLHSRSGYLTMRVMLVPLCALLLHAADAPTQPIPFSHKVHAGTMKLACKMCHSNPDPGEAMTIAGVGRCMECHSAIKTGSPSIQRLAQYAKDGHEVPWVRIYRLPGFVDFSHREHLAAGNTCEECHGPVAEREELSKEKETNMGACRACHAAKKASEHCAYCHILR
jgi:hypothetical protein